MNKYNKDANVVIMEGIKYKYLRVISSGKKKLFLKHVK